MATYVFSFLQGLEGKLSPWDGEAITKWPSDFQ